MYGLEPAYPQAGSRAQGSQQGLAVASMITGIGALACETLGCCCGLFLCLSVLAGIAAIIMGMVARNDPPSQGFAMTGIITGIISLVLAALWVIIGLAIAAASPDGPISHSWSWNF